MNNDENTVIVEGEAEVVAEHAVADTMEAVEAEVAPVVESAPEAEVTE